MTLVGSAFSAQSRLRFLWIKIGFPARLFGCLLVTLLVPPSPSQAQESCWPAVNLTLQHLGLEDGNIRRVSIAEKRELTSEGPRLQGIDAWVRLTDCSGALVIDMSDSCQVRQVYTRGNCNLPGTPKY